MRVDFPEVSKDPQADGRIREGRRALQSQSERLQRDRNLSEAGSSESRAVPGSSRAKLPTSQPSERPCRSTSNRPSPATYALTTPLS